MKQDIYNAIDHCLSHRGRENRWLQAFGETDYGFADTGTQMSNVRLARLRYGRERGCDHCFPHGVETNNSRFRKNRRSWKLYRRHQYLIIEKV